MSTFLCPIDDYTDVYILTVNASNYIEAQDKIEERIRENYDDIPITGNWSDFVKKATYKDIYLGNIYDKDEF